MKVRIIKAWQRGTVLYNRIGEVLEVDPEYAIPGIRSGHLEDITGRIKPIYTEPEVPVEKEKKVTKKERE